ncbi:hypothetical protein [Endozoicomonas sp. 2B-B]
MVSSLSMALGKTGGTLNASTRNCNASGCAREAGCTDRQWLTRGPLQFNYLLLPYFDFFWPSPVKGLLTTPFPKCFNPVDIIICTQRSQGFLNVFRVDVCYFVLFLYSKGRPEISLQPSRNTSHSGLSVQEEA